MTEDTLIAAMIGWDIGIIIGVVILIVGYFVWCLFTEG